MTDHSPDHHIWYPISIAFFAVLSIGVFLWLSNDRWFTSSLGSLGFFDLVILALATFRIIRLVTFDKIFQFFRDWFLNDGHKPRKGFKRLVTELIDCIWCTGMWAALASMFLYFSGLFGVFVVYMFAISALGSVFQNISQMIIRIGAK